MNTRDFTDIQLNYLYSDEKFILFLSQYLSTYDTFINKVKLGHDIENKEIIEEIELLLRVILANINEFKIIISKIMEYPSFIYINQKENINNEIKGTLLIDEYIRKKSMQTKPKTYPCKIKRKSYATYENIYLFFIIKRITFRLEGLFSLITSKFGVNRSFTEIILLKNNIKYFYSLKNKPMFAEIRKEIIKIERIYNDSFPKDKLNQIKIRIAKRQIKNYYFYQQIFSWYDKFICNNLAFMSDSLLNILSYDSKFNDKLFELWVLFCIKETFVNEYRLELKEENHLMLRDDKPVFIIISPNGSKIELFFQKGCNIFWDNTVKNRWKYVKENEKVPLKAIPDIVFSYTDTYDNQKIVLIDVKNRIRTEGNNSEEIYKMLGYYENFRDYLNYKHGREFKYYSTLVFRNDKTSFKENLNTDINDRILNLSVSPTDDDNLNKNQFKELCRFLLEVCGNEGNTTEVIAEYKKNMITQQSILISALDNKNQDLFEETLYSLSEKNHILISSIFNTPDLKQKLENIRQNLERDHFPHIWSRMSDNAKTILSMAECLFLDLIDSNNADYAPVCLEYCRAIECELNKLIIEPFKISYDITSLVKSNKNYKRLSENRDLTLGEVIFILDKCNDSIDSTKEFKTFLERTFNEYNYLLGQGVVDLKAINKDFRRKSAHTGIMKYNDLVKCRQIVLGIGHVNLFYKLLN